MAALELDEYSRYANPLVTRYAGRAMAELWSERQKIRTWRQLWLALAEAQHELGLDISLAQLAELRAHLDAIDFAAAADYERRFRHDVMAHIHAFGDQAPLARPILHLGATSCFVTDNADCILVRESLGLIRRGLVTVLRQLADFARRYRATPALGFTHFQPAQLTTVGKRASLWLYELVLDLEDLEYRLARLPFRGAKGTTGTQASFLALFDGDHDKVRRLDRLVAEKLGFDASVPVCGQTYSRKGDSQVLDLLSGICQSAHKFASDLRLLAHRKELEEPFETEQVGSSAMAYKRNPMRAERLCGLSRFVMALPASMAQTSATQWLERTLDDSALRRLVLPQSFLGTDAVLRLYANVTSGLVVRSAVVARAVAQELPFLAMENVLMAAVRAGGDRQALHERIRRHSQAAAEAIKEHGQANDLVERIKKDEAFAGLDWDRVLNPAGYVGRAPEQTDEFLRQTVEPILSRYKDLAEVETSLDV